MVASIFAIILGLALPIKLNPKEYVNIVLSGENFSLIKKLIKSNPISSPGYWFCVSELLHKSFHKFIRMERAEIVGEVIPRLLDRNSSQFVVCNTNVPMAYPAFLYRFSITLIFAALSVIIFVITLQYFNLDFSFGHTQFIKLNLWN